MPDAPPIALPRLRTRPLRHADLPQCLPMLPPHLGLDEAERRAVEALWPRLVDEPSILCGVVEDLAQPTEQQIQGWGVTIALPPDCVERLRLAGAPSPFVARAVYRALLGGALLPMSDREMGVASARGELALLVLHFATVVRDLADPYVHQVIAAANHSFKAFHEGYRLQALYFENALAAEPYMAHTGLRPRPYDDDQLLAGLAPEHRPVFYRLMRDEAMQMLPGLLARNAFEHVAPRFRLSAAQRRLLWHALFDDSDESLREVTGTSAHGLKKLWRGIYERIASNAPDFFADGALPDDEGKRGPEKRRQVLAYVRQRPEELRPWA
jgi:hypothetical protein